MSPDLKREIKNGQDMAALAFWCGWRARGLGHDESVLWWQERQRIHSARARSMMFDYQEDCHG